MCSMSGSGQIGVTDAMQVVLIIIVTMRIIVSLFINIRVFPLFLVCSVVAV